MFTLRCTHTDALHTHFRVFDYKGASCGELTLANETLREFLKRSWQGNIDWQGFLPEVLSSNSVGPEQEKL